MSRVLALRDRLTWRRLGLAWAALAVLAGAGGGVLQWLGAPREQAASSPAASAPGSDAGEAGHRAEGLPVEAPEVGSPEAGSRQSGTSQSGTSQGGSPQSGTGLVVPHDLASTVAPAVPGPTLLRPSGGPERREATIAPPGLAPGTAGSQVAQAPASGAMNVPAGAPGAATATPPGAPVAGDAARTADGAADGHPAGLPAPVQDGPVMVAAPLAALLEPGPDGLSLPKVGADGLAPMQAYARPFAAPPGAKLVAIVLDGIGLSESDSMAAINALPGAVDLAVSPYAAHPDALLRQARLKGHELLASIPMEPAGSPLNDEGGRALTTDATPEANEAALAQVLGRIQGYAGATGGSDGQRGEHFALSGRPFDEVARGLAARGLLYVDAAGARVPPGVASRGVDLVVDEPPGAASLDARLARLEAMAQENGAALGLAGPPRPVTVERLAAWAKGLASRGFVLAPASALAGAMQSAQPGSAEAGRAGSAAAVATSGRAAGPGDPFPRRAP